jgi:hypothetical protein
VSVWVTIPSARPLSKVRPWAKEWHDRGYQVALWRDEGAEQVPGVSLITSCGRYPGYAFAVNALVAEVRALDAGAEWFVIGGDDTFPAQGFAEKIAAECDEHFAGTFGVMQPTGDRFAGGSIDRIAGSAWIGRRFAEQVYQGQGPLWPEYQHMFVDEELKLVAEAAGVYWPRPDLVQFHSHFMRASSALDSIAIRAEPPPHLAKWNTSAHWKESKALFERRRAAGFPARPV